MEILGALAIGGVLLVAWTLLVRRFPEIVSKGIVKHIEHGYNARLEELRGRIRANEAAVTSSVAYVTATQSELRSKVIGSVEALWQSVNDCQEAYSGLVSAHRLLVPNEMDAFFRGDPVGSGVMEHWLSEYQGIEFGTEKKEAVDKNISGNEILFVSSRLSALYGGIVAVHGRLGFLAHLSFERGRYVDWRTDKLMGSIMESVLSSDTVEEARTLGIGGLEEIVRSLIAEFIEEASGLMRGSREIEHSVPVLRAMLKEQFEAGSEADLHRMQGSGHP